MILPIGEKYKRLKDSKKDLKPRNRIILLVDARQYIF